MLEVSGLSKHFAGFDLRDITFSLEDGYIMGLIGENGSGKSTLIKSILNIYHRSGGKIVVDGKNMLKEEAAAKGGIGVVLDQGMYEENMSCMENAKIYACIQKRFDIKAFKQYMNEWGIDPKEKIDKLSKGMGMKFQIAMAMAARNRLLIMDEPSANLDESSRNKLNKMMLDYVNDGTRSILISTHLTKQIEEIADYILYLNKGQLVMCDDKESVLSRYIQVSGEKYKLKLIPDKLVVGMKDETYSSTALIVKSRFYVPDVSLTVSRPTIEDVMYYMKQGGYKHEVL